MSSIFASDGKDSLQDFSNDVEAVEIHVNELSVKVSNLLNNVMSSKSSQDCLQALQKSRDVIERAKTRDRKIRLELASATTEVPTALRMQKNKLSSALETKVKQFNQLSKQIDNAIERAAKTPLARSASPLPPFLTPERRADQTSIVINTLDNTDNLQTLRQVHQGLETTQQIFDELDCLVRQQQQQFGTLESAAANTKHFTK
ncbi:hypothetical protein GNI_133530 [Gregarina niphandrodes]|uniref:Uncharacterized protein n=1 Tax=Gregarina niphandrodes TaxID=110365 RepID=A0A023B1E4_GRENI|nr:hypothetical protein GNI_133530 [Gregarina niphandrodes]EZG46512.1 hypothetical protein GNI_133530 [Gregarina niphandrodes]|eukprot:XP_011132285.1 hypothetical protein GNI_133530 [Gregarina niphandrodes]